MMVIFIPGLIALACTVWGALEPLSDEDPEAKLILHYRSLTAVDIVAATLAWILLTFVFTDLRITCILVPDRRWARTLAFLFILGFIHLLFGAMKVWVVYQSSFKVSFRRHPKLSYEVAQKNMESTC